MPTDSQSIDNDPFRLSIVAAERLRKALDRQGILFPSLRGSYPVMDRPFVELGGCSAEVAEALAAALEKLEPEG